MDRIAAEEIEVPDRVPNGRRGRLALGGRTHLVRHVGRGQRGSGSGVRQVVVGRELTWRPELSGTGYGRLHVESQPVSWSSGLGREHGTYLSNAGGSPALGARYVYRAAPGWLLSTPVDVPAHGAEAEVLRGQPIDEKLAHSWLGSIAAPETLSGAIFCRDFLHRRWCFPIPDVEHGAVFEAIVWRKGAHTPGWASSPELWGPQPS
jgi:hypothetical protein